jgi:hypothetical protein
MIHHVPFGVRDEAGTGLWSFAKLWISGNILVTFVAKRRG